MKGMEMMFVNILKALAPDLDVAKELTKFDGIAKLVGEMHASQLRTEAMTAEIYRAIVRDTMPVTPAAIQAIATEKRE